MLNKILGGGTIKKIVKSLLTTDKTVSQAGEFAADAKSIRDLNNALSGKISYLGEWSPSMTLNSTYQLPQTALNARILIFTVNRYGCGGSKAIYIPYVKMGGWENIFMIEYLDVNDTRVSFRFSISTSGVLKYVKRAQNWDPLINIAAFG